MKPSLAATSSPLVLAFLALVGPTALAQESAPEPTARVEVATDVPGTVVLLDGAPVGVTPLVLTDVMPGQHEIRIDRPGAAPIVHAFTAAPGSVTVLSWIITPAASPAPAAVGGEHMATAPTAQEKADAWKDVGRAVLDLPWGALALGTSFALVLAAVVFFTTVPSDMPFIVDNDIEISERAWKSAAVVTGVAGAIVGVAAVVLLALRLEPVDRVIDAIRVSTGSRPRNASAR